MPGIEQCLVDAMALPGARGAAVVDWTSGLTLGTVGGSPNSDHDTAAAETAELARMAAEQTTFIPEPADADSPDAAIPVEDIIVTTRTGYHILRFVETPFDSSVFIHLWLDRHEGNLALARIRLRALAENLVLA
ncbi:hypothetical protein [Streptomyces sp. NBC_01803]|uniref:hypothetical protein n=1 Tax=Streptomyces sp. NBC_01803 TaxID=2975946 RepID=UPI002DD928AC|nr:hypothetical protein [Streptomyces sp. NBC_01803]WSA44797.1 hypothetical protein OIE51_11625 [Streptomyces sp. NBC_01803]